MKLTVKPENILEAIALQTRKELSPFLLAMLGMGVSQSVVTVDIHQLIKKIDEPTFRPKSSHLVAIS